MNHNFNNNNNNNNDKQRGCQARPEGGEGHAPPGAAREHRHPRRPLLQRGAYLHLPDIQLDHYYYCVRLPV